MHLEALLEAAPHPACFIARMRFAWRAESAQAARDVFARARRSSGACWQIYVAAAELEEAHGPKPAGAEVAGRIYRLAADKFPDSVPLVVHYAHWLIGRAEHSQLRAALELALKTLPAERCRPVWDLYVHFEARFGSSSQLRALQDRRAEALPAVYGPSVMSSLFACSSSAAFEGLWPSPDAVSPSPHPHATL